ncbi:metalloregulator ArsR/SmtB family transcription factor [Thermaurantiacus sp.]
MRSLVDIFAALSDPSRLRILLLLRDIELSMGELAMVLDQSQPRISRHVRILAEAGLLNRKKEGAFAFVSPSASHDAQAVFRLLDDLEGGRDLLASERPRLEAVRQSRQAALDRWFADHASQWDHMRSLEAPEADVEAAILSQFQGQGCDSLLDLGTGTGRMLELLGPTANHAAGLDRSPEMLRIARAKLDAAGLHGVDLRLGDILALPWPDASFDRIVIHQVLHFIDQPELAIREAARVLAPGGQLLVIDYAPHEVEELRDKWQHQRLGLAEQAVTDMMKAHGLDPREVLSLAGSRLTVLIWRGRKA